MELPPEPALADATGHTDCAGRTGGARASPETGGTAVTVTRTNPLYGHDAPFIRVATAGEPEPVTAAIADSIGESGTVYLELPDGRLTVVLDLEGMTWVPRARDEGARG